MNMMGFAVISIKHPQSVWQRSMYKHESITPHQPLPYTRSLSCISPCAFLWLAFPFSALNLLELFLSCPSIHVSYPNVRLSDGCGGDKLAFCGEGGKTGEWPSGSFFLTEVGLPLHCPNGSSRHSWLALVLHRARQLWISGSYYSACEWVPRPPLSPLPPLHRSPFDLITYSWGGSRRRRRRRRTELTGGVRH